MSGGSGIEYPDCDTVGDDTDYRNEPDHFEKEATEEMEKGSDSLCELGFLLFP